MKITLIRHTRVAVDAGICYGFTDVDVAASFPQEAEAVSEAIKNKTFDSVFSSPLQRCRKLAAACGYTDPIVDNRLKELNCGDWEMKRWEEIDDAEIKPWYNDWVNTPTKNGESFLDQYNRVTAFLEEKKEEGHHHIAVFCHGGVIRCALIRAGLLKTEEAFNTEVDYGSRHIIEL